MEKLSAANVTKISDADKQEISKVKRRALETMNRILPNDLSNKYSITN
jgi:hypothetical protein